MAEYGEPGGVTEEEFKAQCDELGGEFVYGDDYSWVCDTALGGMSYNPEHGTYTIEGEVTINSFPDNVRVHNTPFGKGGAEVEGIDRVDVDLSFKSTNPKDYYNE